MNLLKLQELLQTPDLWQQNHLPSAIVLAKLFSIQSMYVGFHSIIEAWDAQSVWNKLFLESSPDIHWGACWAASKKIWHPIGLWGVGRVPHISPLHRRGTNVMWAHLKITSTRRFPYSIQQIWWAYILQVDIPHQLLAGSTNNNMCRTVGFKHSISQKQQMKRWQWHLWLVWLFPVGDRHLP